MNNNIDDLLIFTVFFKILNCLDLNLKKKTDKLLK